MCMAIVMRTKAREWAVAVVHVPAHIEIAAHANRSIILKFYEATGTVHEPELPNRGGWRQLGNAKGCANNYPVF